MARGYKTKGIIINDALLVCVCVVITGTQDYLCPIDSEVFGEAYEQLASVEPSFYSQKFEDAAQSCLSVMGIRAADIASENCVMVYKFLIAFIEYMHIN